MVPVTVLSLVLGTGLSVAPISNADIISDLYDFVSGSALGVIRTSIFLLRAVGLTAVGMLADVDLFDEPFLLLSVVAAVMHTVLPILATNQAR